MKPDSEPEVRRDERAPVAVAAGPEDEGEPQAAEAEERRLFYVATTRARSELYLCYPSACTTQGVLRISRFLQELDDGTRGTASTPFERWQITTQ